MFSPSLFVISNCVCSTPLPLCAALLSRVYLGSAKGRERNPAGRGDWAQEGGRCVFFKFSPLLFFSFFWLRFSLVMHSASRGSRRSGSRQSQHSSDLVRNAAVLYLFFFFFYQPPFVSLYCVWLQHSACMFPHCCSESLLVEECLKGQGGGLSVCLVCVCVGGGVSLCVHSLAVTAGFPG